MDSPQQALQTNGELFQISISFSNYWPKNEKYSNRVNIDRSAIFYISMDLPLQALQSNGKFLSNHILSQSQEI